MRKPTTLTVSLLLVSLVWALCVVPLSLTLVFVAVTWSGRLFAITALLAGALPYEVAVTLDRRSKIWKITTCTTALGFFVGSVVLMLRAPSESNESGLKARNLYADGRSHFHRFALGNLLPEVDQLMLAFTVALAVDPLLTQRQSSEIKKLTAPIYRELESDPDFHALGSAMPEAYDDLLGWSSARGHAFLYVPANVDRSKPNAALVFLHGSGGNFKAYLWLLSRVAEKRGIIVIAPTCGIGNWRPVDAERIVTQAISAASVVAAIDSENIHALGISNGGLGVCQLARARGVHFRSVVLVSPVFETGFSLSATGFKTSWSDRAVLVLTGRNDDRVPLSYVNDNVAALRRMGAVVTMDAVESANHFLFFSHREQIASSLEKWLATQAANVN